MATVRTAVNFNAEADAKHLRDTFLHADGKILFSCLSNGFCSILPNLVDIKVCKFIRSLSFLFPSISGLYYLLLILILHLSKYT